MDNPFMGVEGALEDIYSYGHRNMQGLVVLPSGEIYEHEHGPRGGDEMNLIKPSNGPLEMIQDQQAYQQKTTIIDLL